MKLCAISVDLDEIDNYRSLHGLPASPAGAHAVYDRALGRLLDWARDERFPLTLFAIGRDLLRAQAAERLRAAARAGQLVENHSYHHHYDLSRRPIAEIAADLNAAQRIIADVTERAPLGFRAPGYLTSPALLAAVRQLGLLFDASVLPSPPYQAAKAAAMLSLRLRGRHSAAIVDRSTSAWASRLPQRLPRPSAPARLDLSANPALWEIPMAVTRRLRLPVIGTSLTLAGPRLAPRLLRGCFDLPILSLELHGIDLLDASDGLADLLPFQPDVRVPWSRKRAALNACLAALRQAGYQLVTVEALYEASCARGGH